MASHLCRSTFTSDQGYPGHLTIDMLSDDVLLCIFDYRRRIWGPVTLWPWDNLVHVCRRWRRIIFGHPRYLRLYLMCKSKTDVLATLDIWPALPLIFSSNLDDHDADKDDIISALEHRDRMAMIHVRGSCSQFTFKKCVALMQEPFPVLTSLWFHLRGDDEMMSVITDAFLGGSAPLLQHIYLGGIRFPGLPKLLSSTSDLVSLNLQDFPMSGEGHIPPDAMTTCLSVLTKLQYLTIIFLRQKPPPYSADQCPPPSTHTVLPALTKLLLQGPHRYLEDLVGRVDTPLLNSGKLEFYDEPVFDNPRVPQFMHRTEMFKLPCKVQVQFRIHSFTHWYTSYVTHIPYVRASFRSSISPEKVYYLSFPCSGSPAQVAITERIFAQCPPLVSRVGFLELDDQCFYSFEGNNRREVITPGPSQWLGLLRQFTAVQTLYLHVSNEVPRIAHMLEGLKGERATEALPALRTIELGYPGPGARLETLRLLGPFLVARKESERPVVVRVVPFGAVNGEWIVEHTIGS